MEEKKFTVRLTETQVKLILALIDVHTSSTEPDFFLNSEGMVYTPMLAPKYRGYQVLVQNHLDKFLKANKLDIC